MLSDEQKRVMATYRQQLAEQYEQRLADRDALKADCERIPGLEADNKELRERLAAAEHMLEAAMEEIAAGREHLEIAGQEIVALEQREAQAREVIAAVVKADEDEDWKWTHPGLPITYGMAKAARAWLAPHATPQEVA